MDLQPPETERSKPERTIQIGESFTVFHPENTENKTISSTRLETRPPYNSPLWNEIISHQQFITLINVDLNDFQIPFKLGAQERYNVGLTGAAGFTPFDPEVGYKVDEKDLRNFTERDEKIDKLHKLYETQPIDPKRFPLFFDLLGNNFDIDKISLEISKKDLIALLEKVRLQLTFPDGKIYEGQMITNYKYGGPLGIRLNSFYPVETGPLQPARFNYTGIFLPSDPEKLAQIQGKFVQYGADGKPINNEETKKIPLPSAFEDAFKNDEPWND